ncbi:MAG: glycosyltransferase [Acidimicrobiales bacterium]
MGVAGDPGLRESRRYPIKVVVADAEAPPEITPERAEGGRYRSALVYFREGRRPLGRFEIELDRGTLSSSAVGNAIRERLAADGNRAALAPMPGLDPKTEVSLPFASVVIPTLCSRIDDLSRCIEALNKLDYPDYEIVVVDNRLQQDERDGRLTPIRDAPRVRIVSERIPGISAAKNRGVVSARGEVVAFTDDDIVVDEGWLRGLVTPLAVDATVSIVAGLVLPKELETEPQGWFEEYTGGFSHGFESLAYVPVRDSHFGRRRIRSVQCKDAASGAIRGQLSVYSAAVRGAAGGSSAIRKALFDELGGFDMSLGTGTPTGGGEDLAFCARALWAGKSVRYEPTSISFHAHRRTYPELVRQVRAWGTGLVAMLTSLIWSDPGLIFGLLALAPDAMWKVLRRAELRRDAEALPSSFPARLRWHELSGMAFGGPAYVVSRVENRLRGA